MAFIDTKLIESLIRNIECPLCIQCGSYLVQKNYFCKKCQGFLFDHFFDQITLNLATNLEVTSFLKWRKFESDSLSEFIYLLKTKTSQQAWFWLVHQLESSICEIIQPDTNTVLIPVPGSKTSYHTNHFCSALQALTGCHILPALQKPKFQSVQKLQKASQRRQTRFIICEEFTEQLFAAQKIYLIDDIVTTGATLKNISETIRCALSAEKRQNIQIQGLTLFYRSLRH